MAEHIRRPIQGEHVAVQGQNGAFVVMHVDTMSKNAIVQLIGSNYSQTVPWGVIIYDQGAVPTSEKDDYRVQRARLERLAKELAPGCEVHFDPDSVPTFVRMRVDDAATGAILIVSSGDWHVSEIADKSDDEVKVLLKSWSGGKL